MLKRYQIKELDGDSVESRWLYDTRCFGLQIRNNGTISFVLRYAIEMPLAFLHLSHIFLAFFEKWELFEDRLTSPVDL